MALALALGRRGQGLTASNPAVGCVIVRDNVIVGRGWTQPGGRPHAEVVALAQAGAAARGASVYVTLEPCAHFGKTPPCADALIAAGVSRVVFASDDPDPRVDGRGADNLRAAGIEVVAGVLEAEAREDHAGFLLRVTEGRPFVTLKLALSLDGRIATGTGESQWITGPEARRLVHGLRARHDAVMVGAGTARQDDPMLTVRGLGVAHQPTRVAVSRRLDLPHDSALARTAKEIPVVLCHGADAPAHLREAWAKAGATLVECATVGQPMDVSDVLRKLGDLGLNRVFCEGGGAFASSLLVHDLVDQLVVFSAGLAIGAEGFPGLGAMGLEALSDAPRFTLRKVQPVGSDTMSVWSR